jgi:selenide,water dikinase
VQVADANYHQKTTILESNSPKMEDTRLLVGNDTRDDAAVYDMGNGTGIISTTDFLAQ